MREVDTSRGVLKSPSPQRKRGRSRSGSKEKTPPAGMTAAAAAIVKANVDQATLTRGQRRSQRRFQKREANRGSKVSGGGKSKTPSPERRSPTPLPVDRQALRAKTGSRAVNIQESLNTRHQWTDGTPVSEGKGADLAHAAGKGAGKAKGKAKGKIPQQQWIHRFAKGKGKGKRKGKGKGKGKGKA